MSIDETTQEFSSADDRVDAFDDADDSLHQIGSESNSRRRKRRKMFCFHCNRDEGHSNPYIGSWFYSYFIGLTFGLIHFFGPFRCQCCGRNRLMFADWINPRFHVMKIKHR